MLAFCTYAARNKLVIGNYNNLHEPEVCVGDWVIWERFHTYPIWLWHMVKKGGKHFHLNTTKQTGWPCFNPGPGHPSPCNTHLWSPYLHSVDIRPTLWRDACCCTPLTPPALTHSSHHEQLHTHYTFEQAHIISLFYTKNACKKQRLSNLVAFHLLINRAGIENVLKTKFSLYLGTFFFYCEMYFPTFRNFSLKRYIHYLSLPTFSDPFDFIA